MVMNDGKKWCCKTSLWKELYPPEKNIFKLFILYPLELLLLFFPLEEDASYGNKMAKRGTAMQLLELELMLND